jgi:light-regulated signal transduction histidine kinase (bacteriophytochrome)
MIGEAGKPNGAIGILLDITERKTAEAKLLEREKQVRSLNAELEQRVQERTLELQAANSELEAFAYSVSHDLRSPLRSINGYSRLLLDDLSDKLNDDGKHYLNSIRTATQRMGQLIEDLLILSRVTRTEMERKNVNLSILAEEILKTMQDEAPERQVNVHIHPDLGVYGDRNLLQVMLENLLENAWKFSRKSAQARIEFGIDQQDGERVYYVRDNGAGFDPRYADKLFGAFERLHGADEFEGTGIGLATVERIIQRHGGRIWASAEIGQGATFYFTFGEDGS